MTEADSCPPARWRRAVALLAAVPLLASLLSLTAAGTAKADDPVAPACATLAVAPFGDPGDAIGEATVAGDASTCYTITAETPGLYQVSLNDSSYQGYTTLQAADGTPVDCDGDNWTTWRMCTVPAAGTYTLSVFNRDWQPQDTAVTFVSLASTRGCADPAGTRWDQPDPARTTVSPVEVDCQPFEAAPGERIRLTQGSKVYGESIAWITDETGARICPHFPENDENTCALPGDGPYRVVSRVSYTERGFPADYAVKARRLDDPQGCTTAPVRPFGPLAAQDATTNPCFTFTADRAGPYDVHYVSENQDTGPVRVYDAAGLTVCQAAAGLCALPAAGTYTAVLDGSYPFHDQRDGLIVLDRASDAGCVAVGTGYHRGELTKAGQYDCLTLPYPQSARIAALTPLSSPGVDAEVEVVDRYGTPQCDAGKLAGGDCALTGAAPYRALVHTEDADGEATGLYTLAFHRTDTSEGCAVLPVGGFTADGAKATFRTGDGVFSHCLGISANAHTPAEVFQLVATSGTASAGFSVVDAAGKKVCEHLASTNGWTVCPLTPGKAHTVLVTGRDQAATYTLARRDISATASSAGCAKTAAAKVGGPSVPGTAGAPGTLTCQQVTTGAATDVVHVNVRDALGTANSAVVGGDGVLECAFRNVSCAVTGYTTHQVLVQTPVTLKAAPEYRLDALRIATAEGPAPECTRVPSVAYGYGPVTGTLDEAHSAVCAVLPTARFDRFTADVKDTSGATTTAVPALYSAKWVNGCQLWTTPYECAAGTDAAASPTVFLLGLPEKASATSYSAKLTCMASLCGTDRPDATAVTPQTGTAGSKVTLKVTGTALGADALVVLDGGATRLVATTASVSADNRTLTTTVGLSGVASGTTWSVSVIQRGIRYPCGSFTVTAPALANTAAPKVTGTAKVAAKVTAASGSWSTAPSSYTYRWNADGRAIAGATASSYTVPAALLGKKLTVTVTAARSGWTSASATSAAVTVVKGDAPRETRAPVISGTAKVGRTLKATGGTWSPAATSYAYQWYASGRAISGATRSSLVLKAAQKGKKISVKVVAHRTGHLDGSASSKETGAVAR
ncbi:Tat pathway signal protein [Streptomyces hilarionis]|uniref:Tat pathway signal protein n=1 Tax=Streptomyces hilarionis TaxID=2839954 RepID=UPI002119E3FE|nr:Tat pathway signal protein [Streptomyces hilarionis]MCQ9129240.1 Tat pathway signal protein [Streptomyces hilarionis]